MNLLISNLNMSGGNLLADLTTKTDPKTLGQVKEIQVHNFGASPANVTIGTGSRLKELSVPSDVTINPGIPLSLKFPLNGVGLQSDEFSPLRDLTFNTGGTFFTFIVILW